MQERQLREKELEEERAEESARREEELREERQLRGEQEARRREEDMRRQIELLRGLVEGVQKQGEKAAKQMERDRDVKVTKLTEEDDIEAYILQRLRGSCKRTRFRLYFEDTISMRRVTDRDFEQEQRNPKRRTVRWDLG